MEKLNLLKNGQWQLVKWDEDQRQSVSDWVDTGMPEHLEGIPAAHGDLRSEMLSDMSERTKQRTNGETGEKEFLLHRLVDHKDPMKYDRISSWTTDEDFPHYWATIASPEEKFKIHSAWIPEKHIHSYVPTVHSKYSEYDEKDEGEALVHPHSFNVHETKDTTPDKSRQTLDDLFDKTPKKQ